MIELDGMTPEQRITILQSTVLSQGDKLEKHHKILVEGNGELPIVERVRNIERTMEKVEKLFAFIAKALIAQTITFAAAALLYFVKLYPILENLSKGK